VTTQMSVPGEHNRTTAAKTADTHDAKVFAPAANPTAVVPGVLIGVAMLSLAVVAVRDLLVAAGWISGPGWLTTAALWVADIDWWDWMWPAAVASIIVGGVLLWLAVRPRRRTHLSVAEHEVLWTRRGDVARRCSAAVSALGGVSHATTVVGRRTVKVSVTVHDSVDRSVIDQVVGEVLSTIAAPLRRKVRIVSARGGDER